MARRRGGRGGAPTSSPDHAPSRSPGRRGRSRFAPTSRPTRPSKRATSDVLEREVSEAIATSQDLRVGAPAPTSLPTRRNNRAAPESEVCEAMMTTDCLLLGTCDTESDVSALVDGPQLRPVLSTPLSDSDTQTATSLSRSQQASQPRDGRTKLYYQGFSFTRANTTSNKISYRCSSYRFPCPARFVFCASAMMFDFSGMEPHTCRAGPALSGATVDPGDHAIDASSDIMEEVDKLASQTNLTQKQIWMAIVKKFYMNVGAPVRGVTEKNVKNRVQAARGQDSSHGRANIMTNPRLTKIKGSHQGFFQFQYAWHNDVKALKKPPKDANGIDQITAWAHPTLLNLLCFENLSWFIDGTFRCAPVDYKQCVTIMIYDLSSKLFLPVLHAATTSMTTKSHLRLRQCVQDAVGSKLVPKDVVCDFESSLIGALREFFPDVTIIGCLFHFKQACRRKMKSIGMPRNEIKVAMSRNVFDILTVIEPTKIAVQGIAWVKAKIRRVCEAKGMVYSCSKWRQFCEARRVNAFIVQGV